MLLVVRGDVVLVEEDVLDEGDPVDVVVDKGRPVDVVVEDSSDVVLLEDDPGGLTSHAFPIPS